MGSGSLAVDFIDIDIDMALKEGWCSGDGVKGGGADSDSDSDSVCYFKVFWPTALSLCRSAALTILILYLLSGISAEIV